MGWCNDVKSKRYYNKLINVHSKFNHEKLFRNDYKYDFFIPINYNYHRTKLGIGSAIFIHLTKNYKPTAGCIGVSEKDFLKLINKNTKINICYSL
jgi:L,D-peptidoglycan transpeptidase YkuD (ErfK/YbiS/YcfS/YnhG family)